MLLSCLRHWGQAGMAARATRSARTISCWAISHSVRDKAASAPSGRQVPAYESRAPKKRVFELRLWLVDPNLRSGLAFLTGNSEIDPPCLLIQITRSGIFHGGDLLG
jgi:hypothetical protein